MSQLEIDVQRTIEEYDMLRAGDRVLVGLSGGADSVCLLEILHRLRENGRLDIELYALHVHHGLRESADADEDFVRALCGERGIPLAVCHTDAAAYARRFGLGVEEAGRMLRRRAYGETAGRLGAGTKVALAHHIEDSAETLLANLCRGASLAGLCGIRPVCSLSDGKGEETGAEIIRPLIRSSREEIENWLLRNGLSWRTDETNQDNGYTRNFLRNQIFPELHGRVNSSAAEHMAGTALEILKTEEYLQSITEQAAARCLRMSGQGQPVYLVQELDDLPDLLRGRVLYLALTQEVGGAKDISSVHVQALRGLLSAEGTAFADLPGGLRAIKEYDILRFEHQSAADAEPGERSCLPHGEAAGSGDWQQIFARESAACGEAVSNLKAQRRTGDPKPEAAAVPWPLSAEDYEIHMLPRDGRTPPSGRYTKWFDYDKISQPIQLRTRRKGDHIATERLLGADDGEDSGNGSGEKTGYRYRYKKLTRVMIDEKVPALLRDRVVLPMDGDEVLWFPGWRISAGYLVTDTTRRILEITWRHPDGPDMEDR